MEWLSRYVVPRLAGSNVGLSFFPAIKGWFWGVSALKTTNLLLEKTPQPWPAGPGTGRDKRVRRWTGRPTAPQDQQRCVAPTALTRVGRVDGFFVWGEGGVRRGPATVHSQKEERVLVDERGQNVPDKRPGIPNRSSLS